MPVRSGTQVVGESEQDRDLERDTPMSVNEPRDSKSDNNDDGDN